MCHVESSGLVWGGGVGEGGEGRRGERGEGGWGRGIFCVFVECLVLLICILFVRLFYCETHHILFSNNLHFI